MKKGMISIICVAALLINAYFAYFGYTEGGVEDHEEEDENVVVPDDEGRTEGYEFKLDLKKEVTVGNVTLDVTVLAIDHSTVTLLLGTESPEVTVGINKPVNLDTDKDGYYDLRVHLTDIDEKTSSVDIRFTLVHIEKKGENGNWVRPPPNMIGDDYGYDFSIFAEIFWENKTSGNYTRYTLRGEGQWDNAIYPVQEAETGFGDLHDTILKRQVIDGKCTIILDSKDSGKVSVDGSFSAENKVYTELRGRQDIKSVNHGELSIDQLPKASVPVPINYVGDMRYYPDPHEVQKQTLNELVWKDKNLSEGDSGSVFFEGSSEASSGFYNWSADYMETLTLPGGERMDALRVNVSSGLFGFLDFQKTFWLSPEHPYPVKVFMRTNQSWEDDNTSAHTIIEQERTLKDLTRGDEEIPWAPGEEATYPETHPEGEYLEWDRIPRAGYKFEGMKDGQAVNEKSNIHLSPERAYEFALENSDTLGPFLDKYPDAYVTDADFNASVEPTDLQGNAGTQRWNLTWKGYMSEREAREYRRENGEWPERRHWSRVVKNITRSVNLTRPLKPDYSAETEIEGEKSHQRGFASRERNELDEEGCTLSGAIDVIGTDDVAREWFFDGDGGLDVGELELSVGKGATASDMPGAEVVEILTGITVPHFDSVWHFHRGSVYYKGEGKMAGLDLETGRLAYVTEISGTQIMGLFS